MGSVYRAQHTMIERQVAIKLLKPECSKRPDILGRFFEEARSVNRIQHPNIIDVLDFGKTPSDEYFIVMELLEGRELTKVLQEAKGPLPARRIGHIGLQLCAALDAAHQNKIVHRDLKTDNVFLTFRGDREDYVKVLDFGIAKLLGETASSRAEGSASSLQTLVMVNPNEVPGDSMAFGGEMGQTVPDQPHDAPTLPPSEGGQATQAASSGGAPGFEWEAPEAQKTRAGAVIGTPLYMSPEQALGGQVDEQTDVYALGVILYLMATGRPPFYHPNFQKLVFMHVTGKVVAPRELNPALPKRLEDVILRCLAKEKKDRFSADKDGSSMAKVAIALGEASELDPRPYFQITGKKNEGPQSFLGRWWLAIVVALLVVVGLFALLRSGVLSSLVEDGGPPQRVGEVGPRAVSPRLAQGAERSIDKGES